MSEQYLINQIRRANCIYERTTKELLIKRLKHDRFYHKLASPNIIDLMYKVSTYLPLYRNLAQPNAIYKLYCELLSYNRVWCIKHITANTIYNIISTYHDINKDDARNYLQIMQRGHDTTININAYKKRML